MDNDLAIRQATITDAEALYAFATAIPELRVSATHAFMDRDEFEAAIRNPQGVMLLAEIGGTTVGFVYANADDPEKQGAEKKWACLVYMAVAPEHRGKGLAKRLYLECERRLKGRGATHLYGWANVESDGSIVRFMRKRGFAEGHTYRWMDKEI